MWVIYDDGHFRAWYGGWKGPYDKNAPKLVHLGSATSEDGIHWKKNSTPVYSGSWTEDLCVLKLGGKYYMYAENETKNTTHVDLITSDDGVQWTFQSTVLEHPGGWLGTPLVWKEPEKWYMLFEDQPAEIHLATSTNGIKWQKKGLVIRGPTGPSSIIKRDGRYYLFYTMLAPDHKRWHDGMAQSTDLTHWTKYSGNPLVNGTVTSAVIVETPTQYMLYGWNGDSKTAGGSQYSLHTAVKTAWESSSLVLPVRLQSVWTAVGDENEFDESCTTDAGDTVLVGRRRRRVSVAHGGNDAGLGPVHFLRAGNAVHNLHGLYATFGRQVRPDVARLGVLSNRRKARTVMAPSMCFMLVLQPRGIGMELSLLDAGGINSNVYNAYGGNPGDPAYQTGFKNYCVAMVNHYKGTGTIFELWNEPNVNIGGVLPYLTPSQYMGLMNIAVPAMRAADPNVTIIGPASVPAITSQITGCKPVFNRVFSTW